MTWRQERTVIAVGSRPPEYNGQGTLFDGRVPLGRPVRLGLDDTGQALLIRAAAADPQRWPFGSLRRVPGQAGDDLLILANGIDDPARLHLPGPDARLIATRARALGRGHLGVRRGRLAALVVAAVASVALMLTVLVPLLADRLADYLPPAGEAALGEATLEQVRGALGDGLNGPLGLCDGEDGQAALTALEARLDAEVAITLRVLDGDLVNAFALPGGNVILFRGLIEAAETPEEVAAVLAHEIGHVAARDPTRIALRSAGSIGVLGLLFGDFAGGALVLFLTERMIAADYTQEAEAAADAYAHALLARADISPAAIGDFFERIRAERGDTDPILQHFMAHPEMADRIAAARAAVPEGLSARPALTAPEWAALRAICD